MLRKFLILTFVTSPLLLAGCSGLALPFGDRFADSDKKARSEEKKLAAIAAQPEIPPSVLLNSGVHNVNIGNSKKAQKAFNELNKQHPFSTEAQRSLVLSAYTHFTEKEYDQTIGKANQFLQLYPGSKDAAYMQYLIGESYHVRVGSVVLDQADTAKGLQAYSDLVRLYPDSKYVSDAKTKMLFMADQLAGKEMQIGRYYQERRQFLAAVNRFRTVVDTHQTTRHIEEALYRLTESYLALGLVNDARSATSLLGHNYPDSRWYADAYDLINGGKAKSRKGVSSKVAGLVPFTGKKNKKDANETLLDESGLGANVTGTVPEPATIDATPVLAVPSEQSAETSAGLVETSAVPTAAPTVPVVDNASVAEHAVIKPRESAPLEVSTQVVAETETVVENKRAGFSRFIPFVGSKKKDENDS